MEPFHSGSKSYISLCMHNIVFMSRFMKMVFYALRYCQILKLIYYAMQWLHKVCWGEYKKT